MAKGIYIGEVSEKYTEVEYLQSSGTQYIDTGYKPGGNTRVICEFTRIANSPTANYGAAVFGARQAKNNYDYTFWGFNHVDDKLTDNYYSTDKSMTFPGTERVVVDKNKNVTTVNNNSSYSVTHTYTNFTSSYNLYIFATNKAGSPDTMQMGTIRVYYMKIYDNDVLVRDFVPAVDIKGQYGFFDKLNNQFYTNKGSGTFVVGNNTGNVLYENSTAQKVKKIYAGINNVARKIKKAYIGIGGVARPCWGKGELAYYGEITNLSVARSHLSAASTKRYAIFAGGWEDMTSNTVALFSDVVDVYDSSLIKYNPTGLSSKKRIFSGTSFGDYAVFAGGFISGYSNTIDVYDASLTRTNPATLSQARFELGAASIGEYVLFAGGYASAGYSNVVDAYNNSFTRTNPTNLSASRQLLVGITTTKGGYALFGGGKQSSYSSVVDAYDRSLVRTIPTKLSSARGELSAASVGEYVLFAGGYTGSSFSSAVDAYDNSLTRTSPTSLSLARRYLSAASTSDYALFYGGSNSSGVYNNVDVYDSALSKNMTTTPATNRQQLAAASVGNFVLFGGGRTSSALSNLVDAYIQL